MLLLPTFNATLQPCAVGAAHFTAHEQGHFCGSCQRVVQDFSQSANPVADLAAARAASADGRVCGRFSRAQTMASPTLTQRLRWFLVALVLVVGQGLTAREALAQVRKPIPKKSAVHHKNHTSVAKKQPMEETRIPEEPYYTSGVVVDEPVMEEPSSTTEKVYTYVEQMPQLPGGGGTPAVIAYIQQRLRRPTDFRKTVEGRVYASFTIDKNGLVRDAKILKGLEPLLDAETLRVIQALPTFAPGQQSGQRVAVSFTAPIAFKIE